MNQYPVSETREYVELWLKDKQSVSNLVDAFSTTVLKTNMTGFLNGGGSEAMISRAEVYARFRSNRDVFMLDKETEDFEIAATPLSSLDALQAQSQEHMAAIGRIPLVKLFGITPSGLNASSDGEIRTFYDSMHAQQEADFRKPLKRCVNLIQLSEFGEIDPDIDFVFEPLWQLDDAGEAAVEKTWADIDEEYMTSGVLAPDEVRQVIARRKESRYAGLDLDEPAPGTSMVNGDGTPIADPLEKRVQGEATAGAASGV